MIMDEAERDRPVTAGKASVPEATGARSINEVDLGSHETINEPVSATERISAGEHAVPPIFLASRDRVEPWPEWTCWWLAAVFDSIEEMLERTDVPDFEYDNVLAFDSEGRKIRLVGALQEEFVSQAIVHPEPKHAATLKGILADAVDASDFGPADSSTPALDELIETVNAAGCYRRTPPGGGSSWSGPILALVVAAILTTLIVGLVTIVSWILGL